MHHLLILLTAATTTFTFTKMPPTTIDSIASILIP
jgi:hypothetical protein